jgi:hypothetical protein
MVKNGALPVIFKVLLTTSHDHMEEREELASA